MVSVLAHHINIGRYHSDKSPRKFIHETSYIIMS
jgi:hypothetical protein